MDFNSLKNFNWESLKRTDLGASYSSIFDEISSVLQRADKLILELENTLPLFILTDASKLQSIFNQTIDLRTRTQNFNTQGGETAEQTRARASALLEEIRGFYETASKKLSEFQMYSREQQGQKIEEALNSYKSKSQEILTNSQNSFDQRIGQLDQKLIQLDQAINQVNEIKNNVEQLNTAVQDFSLVDTVTEYGTIFSDQAKTNKNSARYFGIAFVVLIISAVLVLIFWFLPLVKEVNIQKNIVGVEYYIFGFLIRFSVLFFLYLLIKEILKNYNTNSHMYHLNTHRSNSLKSFDILVRNNKLPENRDALVKEIAQTIFTHQDDGYLNSNQKDVSISDITSLITALRK